MAEDNTIVIGARTEPANNAPAGTVYIWMGSNGHLYSKTDAGVVIDMGESATEYSTFLSLTDTPSAYTSQNSKMLQVNAAGNAVEFVETPESLWEENETGEGIRPKDHKELVVGSAEHGVESAFGGGDSYNDDIYVVSYDGSSYVDETSKILTAGDGNYLEFPSLNAGAIVYFGSDKTVTHTGNKAFHCGYKSTITQTMDVGAGSVVFEYYGTSGWTEFTHMTTDANHPYQSYGNQIMMHTGIFQTRYSCKIKRDWAQTVINGNNLFWARARIVSAITSSMRLDFLKLHTSRVEINATGFIEFFGRARPVKWLGVTYGSFQAAGNSPANNDIYLSDKLDIGRIENEFQSDTVDRSGFTKIMPLDLDSSTPLKLRVKYFITSGNAGDAKMVLRWGTTRDGDAVYDSNNSPTTGPDEQEYSAVIPFGANEDDTEKIMDAYLDVSHVIPEIGTNDATSLWVTFERQGTDSTDTYGGNVILIDVEMYYMAWRIGGYEENY